MTLPSYDRGDLIRLGNATGTLDDGAATGAFLNVAGVATDPTAVTLTVQKPDGSNLIYGWPVALANGALTREAAGRFYFDLSIDASGTWRWRLAGTGAVETAQEGEFYCRKSLLG